MGSKSICVPANLTNPEGGDCDTANVPVAVKAIARLGRGLVSLTEPRFLRYDRHMAFSLRDLRLNGVQHELLMVAACCKHGLAETVPIDDEKRLSCLQRLQSLLV